MMNFRYWFIFLFPLIICQSSLAQDVPLSKWEDSLKVLGKIIQSKAPEELRLKAANQCYAVWEEALRLDPEMNFNFDSVKYATRLISDDRRLRVITWLCPMNNGNLNYFGIIALKAKPNDALQIQQLHQTPFSGDFRQFENQLFSPANWYGCIYYSLVTVKYKKKFQYLLLGWDGSDKFTTRKLIEPLTVSSNGQIKMGEQVFKIDRRPPRRMVYAFAKTASMSLRYYPDKKQIIMDHLSPSEPQFKDKYQFYGPDFSYDALEFKKGKWVLIPDVKPINEKKGEEKQEVPKLKDEKLYKPK